MSDGWAVVVAGVLAAVVTVIGYIVAGRGLGRIEKLTNVIEKLSPGTSRSKLIRLRGELIDRYTRRRESERNWSNVWLIVDLCGLALYFAGALIAQALGTKWEGFLFLISLVGVIAALVGTVGIVVGSVFELRDALRRRRKARGRKSSAV